MPRYLSKRLEVPARENYRGAWAFESPRYPEDTFMHVDLDQLAVVDNEADQRFEARLGDDLAVAEYRRKDGMIVFTHTEVPVAFEGKGIANRLARTALDRARGQQLAVVPLCPFFASYIRRHAEYQDLVHPEYRHLIGDG